MIVFFDGVCNLCQSSVKYLIKYDSKQQLKFATLQGQFAKQNLNPNDLKSLDSILLFDGQKVYKKSDAILKLCTVIGRWHKLLLIGYFIPTFLRDWAYNLIAQNRYQWFGQQDHCLVPTKDLKFRFLE